MVTCQTAISVQALYASSCTARQMAAELHTHLALKQSSSICMFHTVAHEDMQHQKAAYLSYAHVCDVRIT